MIVTSKNYSFGDLMTLVYSFPKKGDILPMHKHDEDMIHITIITNGLFKVSGPWGEITAKPGQILDWAVGQEHELVALEDNSKFINILKNINK